MNTLQCTSCPSKFTLSTEELAYYIDHKYVVPTKCPNCRHQQRLSFRNEKSLYKRPCGLCGTSIVSVFAPEKPYIVYCSNCFWSDSWDQYALGMEYDFSRPFIDQFKELQRKVPYLANVVFNSTNCDYNAFCTDSKDCYMSSRTGDAENSMYSYLTTHCVSCVDSMNMYTCQYCYECIDCWNSYQCWFSELLRDCSDCAFCYDCIGCRNCFGSVGLRNAEYYFFNQKCSREEYEQKMKEYVFSSYENLEYYKKYVQESLLQFPRRATYVVNSQNVNGDFIVESKDVVNSFDIEKTDTVYNSWGVEYAKDIYDCDFIYYGERCYNMLGNSRSTDCECSFSLMNGNYNISYSMFLYNNCHDCFGSIGLKKAQYTILNKPYERDAYFALKQKIVDELKSSYGDFFPPAVSCFGYNESVAQLYFPLQKEEALAKGFNWFDQERPVHQLGGEVLPDSIFDVRDDILSSQFSCAQCERNYKIVPQELAFYRKFNLPIPRICSQCRHRNRVTKRNPHSLFDRQCSACSKPISSSYDSSRPEKILCESCYSHNIYN